MVMLNPGLLLRFCRALHNPCKGALSRRHRLLLQSQESARRGWLHLRGKSIQLMLPLAQMLKVRAERSLVLPHLRWKWNSLVLHDTVVADRTSMCTTILFHSSFQCKANKLKQTWNVGHVWPMPLPYPTLGRRHNGGKLHATKQALNAMILVLNWLSLNQPVRAPSDYVIDAPLNSEQKKVVMRFTRLMQDWIDCPAISAADMGRSAGKVETVEMMLQQLTVEAMKVSREQGSGKIVAPPGAPTSMLSEVQVAKEMKAHKLKFGGRPQFNPMPFLDPETAEMYDKPLTNSTPPWDSTETPPKVQVRGSRSDRSEILALLKAFDETDRLGLFPEQMVRMEHRAGLFSLMKNLTTDRLILDSRPANILEEGYTSWTQSMGSILPLFQLHLQPGEELRVAGEDLRDFYYYFVVSQERSCRNSLAITLTKQEASQFKAFHKLSDKSFDRFVPSLRTMAMGDKNAVEYGQQSHAQLCLATGLRLTDLLTLRGSMPRQAWAAGVLIDDFIVVEKVPERKCCTLCEFGDCRCHGGFLPSSGPSRSRGKADA